MSELVIRVPPTSRAQLREDAAEFRHLLGLQEEIYFPIVEVLEHAMPYLVPGFAYDILSRADMGKREGFVPLEQKAIELREDVYELACSGDGRARFTIAHEVAHLVLHANRGGLARQESGAHVPAYRDPEWQANTFASNLLIYWRCLDPNWDIGALMRECGVSHSAATVQLEILREDGLI